MQREKLQSSLIKLAPGLMSTFPKVFPNLQAPNHVSPVSQGEVVVSLLASIAVLGVVLIVPVIQRQASLCILLSLVIATLCCVLAISPPKLHMLLSVLPLYCMSNMP